MVTQYKLQNIIKFRQFNGGSNFDWKIIMRIKGE